MKILTQEMIEHVKKKTTSEQIQAMKNDKGYKIATSSRDKILKEFLNLFDQLILDDQIDDRAVLFYIMTTAVYISDAAITITADARGESPQNIIETLFNLIQSRFINREKDTEKYEDKT